MSVALFHELSARVALSLHQDEVRLAADALRELRCPIAAERLETTLNRLLGAARVEEAA